jgi:hypothetical protein
MSVSADILGGDVQSISGLMNVEGMLTLENVLVSGHSDARTGTVTRTPQHTVGDARCARRPGLRQSHNVLPCAVSFTDMLWLWVWTRWIWVSGRRQLSCWRRWYNDRVQ